MRNFFLLVTSLLIAAMPALAQTTPKPEPNNSAEQTVLKLIQEWIDAEERIDRAVLNRIIADDFLGTGPRGTIV